LVPALVVGVGLVLAGCTPSGGPGQSAGTAPDTAADRQAVIDAHQALVDAYMKGDAGAFVLLLEKSDDLLIYHPRLQDRWTGVDEVQQNLSNMFERLGESSWLDVHLDLSLAGDVAWLTSQVVIESPSVDKPFTGRGTEVWVRRGSNWRLIHGHWSENPEY
jgi:ketosteroid isomerase-like protein